MTVLRCSMCRSLKRTAWLASCVTEEAHKKQNHMDTFFFAMSWLLCRWSARIFIHSSFVYLHGNFTLTRVTVDPWLIPEVGHQETMDTHSQISVANSLNVSETHMDLGEQTKHTYSTHIRGHEHEAGRPSCYPTVSVCLAHFSISEMPCVTSASYYDV